MSTFAVHYFNSIDVTSVLPRIKKWVDICTITFETEGTFSKP